MSSPSVYRANAEICLRMAQVAASERDKPFWLTLAQSWINLAEHSARGSDGREQQTPLAHYGAEHGEF
jgi:hypothetical protein